MVTKLTRTGDSVAVVLDKAVVDALGLAEGSAVEVSTDGQVITIAPVQAVSDEERLRAAEKWAHDTYASAFERLAK